MGTPQLILVTGPAGSGKTTLAHELATRIGCPALCRDELKEGMVASNPGFVPTTSDELTMRTYDLFFDLIDRLLAAEVTLVAEAAFQHRIWTQGLQRLQSAHRLFLVRCVVDGEAARMRVRQRLQDQASRTAHADVEYLAAAAPFDALRLDGSTAEVDTTDGYRPGLTEILQAVRGEVG